MQQSIRPVDVICVCSAEGEIRPLRIRLEDERRELIRIDIEEVVSRKEIPYIGAEATIFWCRGVLWGRCCLLELKYSMRCHTWYLLSKLHG